MKDSWQLYGEGVGWRRGHNDKEACGLESEHLGGVGIDLVYNFKAIPSEFHRKVKTVRWE